MKRTIALVMALLMALSIAGCSGNNDPNAASPDKVYEFNFSMHDPEPAGTSKFIKAWADIVEEASGGRIKFKFFFSGSLASVMDSLDAVQNGTVDLAWNSPAVFPSRFLANCVSMLPLVGLPANADGGQILWEMYLENEDIRNEWRGFKVIALQPNGNTALITKSKKIESYGDLSGMRIRSGNSFTAAFMEEMDLIPIAFSVADIFTNLEKNIIDSSMNDWNFSYSHRLFDICKYALDQPMFVPSGCIVMNEDAYARLPDDLKAILDEHSGLFASRLGGEMMEAYDREMRQQHIDNGMDVYAPSPELLAQMKLASQAGVDVWLKEAGSAGRNAQKVYDDFIATLARFGYN